jgi:hypothetical protein
VLVVDRCQAAWLICCVETRSHTPAYTTWSSGINIRTAASTSTTTALNASTALAADSAATRRDEQRRHRVQRNVCVEA